MRMMDRYDTVIVLVDFQTKLAPKMQNAEETESTIIRMVRAARVLGMLVLFLQVHCHHRHTKASHPTKQIFLLQHFLNLPLWH